MATILAHAALPLVASAAFRAPAAYRRRLAIVSAACACLPDLDLVTFLFERRPPDVLAHGGLAHSLVAAAVVAFAAGIAFFRGLGIGSRGWWRVFAFLFGATASHGLLDAMTATEFGVALFAPLENGRHFLPWRPIPSMPAGIGALFGEWTFLTIANEILYAIVPVVIVVTFVRAERAGDVATAKRTVRLTAAWLFAILVLRAAMPEWFLPYEPRVVSAVGSEDAGDPRQIPTDELPDGKLVTRLDELRALGLFDRLLAPANATWSSSFFPSWFGGEAGRWRDGAPTLVWRTLVGVYPPSEADARSWLARAAAGDAEAEARIWSLAPTEKLDLAFDRLDFPATRQALLNSHDARPRPLYWSGRCNGISTAALYAPEPFRVVDVVEKSGAHVRFHPNDVKALLSVAYYQSTSEVLVGKSCDRIAFDAAATCSMNPAVLVLAIMNRLGLAKRSFLIDALPTIAKQYYPVASARVRLLGAPRPPDHARIDASLAGRVASLVDVAIEMTLASTTLAYARADVLDTDLDDETTYRRVGVVPVVERYEATLALDASSELVGGTWTGDPPNGPDNVVFVASEPVVRADGSLAAADAVSWAFVRELARASTDAGGKAPTIDLRRRTE